MYKIDFVKKLDIGTSNVETEGEVTYAQEPKHIKSKPEDEKAGKRAYDFWSQFIFLKDDTEGSIGVSLFVKEGEKIEHGNKIIVKGKIDGWTDKEGTPQKKLTGRLVKPDIEPEQVKQKVKPVENETKKDTEKVKPQNVNVNNNYKISSEQEIRKEAVTIAFDYGFKENFSIHDCLDLAKTIGVYIKSGEVNIIAMNTEEKLVKKESEKVTKVKKEKPKTEIKEKEEKPEKTTKDLEKLFHSGKEIGLSTWVELVGFAVKKDIFPVGTSVEDARVKLLANDKNCYDSLIDFMDIKEDVNSLPGNEQPTDEIPF